MDIKSFDDDNFDTKEWINRAYRSCAKPENKAEFVNNTLATLQLYMQQLNYSLEETTSHVVAGLPRLVVEAGEAELGARVLRGRATAVEDALGAAQRAAGQPLLTLQRTDRLKTRLETARQGLREADKWAALAGGLEAALEAGGALDLPSITKLLEDMNECLELLSGSPDYEDKRLQLEGLKNRLEAVLSPAVVEAFTSHHTEKCLQLWRTFGALGRRAALGAYRARCEAGALRASAPAAAPPAGLRDMHAMLLRHANHQLEWAPIACPGEATLAWLCRLQVPLLGEVECSELGTLHALRDTLHACDHYAAEMAALLSRDESRRGEVSEADLRELALAIYSPARAGLGRLGSLLAASLAEDLGPIPAVELGSSEAGTVLQLRVARARTALTARLIEGRALSRGSAPAHLTYAVQWLMEELCAGWARVSELAGCLALLRASAHAQALQADTERMLLETEPEDVQRWQSLPVALCNWSVLLQPAGRPPAPSAQAAAPATRLNSTLRATALRLVLAPISQHLDGVESLAGWSDNEQYASDLPDFSLSPQEYVTQVGQYLLTLPQHLEPLMERGELTPTDEDPAFHFLNQVCNSVCEMLAEKITAIKNMDSLGIRKCTTDIAYLSSILEELGAGGTGPQLLAETLARRQPAVPMA